MTKPKIEFIEREGGFGIFIRNRKGQTLSIQHGNGNYCTPTEYHAGNRWTFEIALMGKDGEFIRNKWTADKGNDVRGWVTLEELNEVLKHVL